MKTLKVILALLAYVCSALAILFCYVFIWINDFPTIIKVLEFILVSAILAFWVGWSIRHIEKI